MKIKFKKYLYHIYKEKYVVWKEKNMYTEKVHVQINK